MNDDKTQRTTFIAGLFVLAGLILAGALIFQFGTLRHRLRQPYTLYANFLDAQNLIKGAPVKRAGATIGQVVSSPRLVDGLKGVQVKLEIYPEFQIPVGSPLRIASVGMVGDTLLDVGQVPTNQLTGEYIKPGSTIDGLGSPDLMATANRLTDEIMLVLRDLKNGLSDLNVTVGKLNHGVLSDANLENFSGGLRELRESIQKVDNEVLSEANRESIRLALADFRDAMDKIDGASARAGSVLDKADSAMAKVDKAMDGLGPALKGAEGATITLKQAATSLEGLLKDARSGKGLMNALLNDEALAKDFTSFISNLNQRGFLFYKNKPKDQGPAPAPTRRVKPYGAR